jgi:lycopene cyclase domain-containing protein
VTYTAAALLAAAATIALDLLVLRTRLLAHKAFWVAYAIILGCQLITNGVLTGRGVVRYDPQTIVGTRIAYAPVEDLLFGFALVVQTLSWWVFWGRRATTGRQPARPPRGGGAG